MIHGKRGIGIATLVLATGVALALARQQASENERRMGAASGRLAQAESQLADLQSELKRTQALSLTMRQSGPPLQFAPAERPEAAASTAPRTGEAVAEAPPAVKKEVTTDEIRDGLSSRFYSETYDSNWSAVARQKFEKRLSEMLTDGSKLMSVDCKSSICRAEISHLDRESYQRFAQGAVVAPSVHWDGSTMISLAEQPGSARVVSVVFLAREGQGLSIDDPLAL